MFFSSQTYYNINSYRLKAKRLFKIISITSLIRRTEVDKASFFSALSKLWPALSSPITLLLIATKYSPVVQGYFFTFYSLIALQTFVELGLPTVIIQFASHEWLRLRIGKAGKVSGDPLALSRLTFLFRFVLKWYSFVWGVLILALGFGGYLFFNRTPETDVKWAVPWILLCILSGTNFIAQGVLFFLEGCNQVYFVYKYRVIQKISASIALWIAIITGADLWACAITSAVGVTILLTLVFKRYWIFFQSLLSRDITTAINWKTELWPFQRNISVSFLATYFISFLYNPVMFHYHGPVVAGQMGITLSMVLIVGFLGYSLVQPKIPRLGMLIADRNFEELDRLFLRISIISVSVGVIGSAALFTGIYLLNISGSIYCTRILPLLPTGLLLLTTAFRSALQLIGTYLRAHKKEPLMWLSLVTGFLWGISTWQLGANFGALGAIVGGMLITIFIELPWATVIFFQKRREWHRAEQ